MAEGTNMDAIIDGWKNFRPDVFQPGAETEDFNELDGIFREQVGNDENRLTVERDGVIIEKFTNLDEPLLYIEYKRYSNVYDKMMYNKFFVPIWRAAMNGRTGYVAYPKLTPLKDVLDDFAKKMKQNKTEQEKKKQELEQKNEQLEKLDKEMTKLRDELSNELKQLEKERRSLGKDLDKLEKELENILRLSLPPIALAIDALHKDQPNKRTMYYHRDVCIDNIYLYKEKDKEGKLVYDDARLMLTKLTRGSHEDYVDDKTSSESLYKKYHYHHFLKDSGKLYHRIHDWYSFGVYILEVLDMFYGDDDDLTEFRSQRNYSSYATYLMKRIEEKIKERKKRTDFLVYSQQYLDIAKRCLELEEIEVKRKSLFELKNLKERFMTRADVPCFEESFEYPMCEWTAELLWLYENARPTEYETYNQMNDKCHSCGEEYDHDKEKKECSSSTCKKPYGRENGRCQACHLRNKDRVYTKMYSREVKQKHGVERKECEPIDSPDMSENCYSYCFPCYTSGERLFCTERHGTASTILGYHSSYALILFGEFDKNGKTPNPYECDANRLKNALQHKLIYGMPTKNILVAPLYHEERSPEVCLEQHCALMSEKIHGRNSMNCTGAAYTLFLFYSGEGGKKDKGIKGDGDKGIMGDGDKGIMGDGDKGITGDGEGKKAVKSPEIKHNEDGGDWRPLMTRKKDGEFMVIERETIDRLYKGISNCCNSKCEARCVGVTSISDNCYPPEKAKYVPMAESKNWSTQLCTEYKEKAEGRPEKETNGSSGTSDITHWFCQLLRSLYYERCCTPSCKDECREHIIKDGEMHFNHKCQVKSKGLPPCKWVTRHIHEEQHNVFIDGACLERNVYHTGIATKYSTKIRVQICPTDLKKVILAYFNPQGVYLKAFPFKEVDDTSRSTAGVEMNQGNADLEMKVLDVDFDCEMKCETVRKNIEGKLKQSEKYKDKDLQICLLTTLTQSDDYSKYELVCDDNINDRIGSYVLYYHVITKPVQVILTSLEKRQDGEDICLGTLELKLDLDETDLAQMAYDGSCEKPTQLPNFFVFIVYKLRYSDSSDERQPQDGSGADLVIESFRRKLVCKGNWESWDSVEDSAKSYWTERELDVDRFKLLDGRKITVQWRSDI